MKFEDQTDIGDIGPSIEMSTRYDTTESNLAIPRELVLEIECNADSIDEAMTESGAYASGWATIIAFALNAPVDTPQPIQALDITPNIAERPIREYFHRLEDGLPGPGRFVDPQLVAGVAIALHASANEPRVARSVSQYEVALRYWTPHSLMLAAAHLYMACDALAPAIEETYRRRKTLTREQHAEEFGITIKGERCSICGTDRSWRVELDRAARLEYIFHGDDDLYQRSRKMSNAFEHGFTDIPEIRREAEEITPRLFQVVRTAIFDVAEIDIATTAKLVDLEPIDVSAFRFFVEGSLVGDVNDPNDLAPEGEQWPRSDLKISLNDLTIASDIMRMTPLYTMTANVKQGISLRTKNLSWSPGLNTGRFLEMLSPTDS